MKKTIVILLFLLSILDLFSQEPQKFYNIQNLDVNSEYADFGVTFYKDNLVLFASSMKDRTIKRSKRGNNRTGNIQFYKGRIRKDGQIIDVTRFSTENFNLFHESDITFANDSKTIYFTFKNYIDKDYRKNFLLSMTKKYLLNISKATINERGIASNLTPLPFNGKNYSVHHPRLSPDGKTLFFISDMEGSYGGTDIYKVSILIDGSYSIPENLGLKINTAGNEMFPFLSNDNTFYFSSDGHPGKGGLDIFSSKLVNDEFSQVKNLDQLNYSGDDFAFVINDELNVGYFSSVREGNKGDVDIFSFNLEPIRCNQSIAGIVKNNKTNELLANAEVELFINNKRIETTISNENGVFNFETVCETAYTIKASKTDFIQKERNHTSSKINKETTEINFSLEPIECNQSIAGIVRDKENGQILANAEVQLFINNKSIETTISNENGAYTFATICEKAYTIKASKSDYLQEERNHTSSKINKESTEINFSLEPIECNQSIAGIVRNKENGQILANAEVQLFINNKSIETTISNENGAYNFATICEKSYTIKAAKNDYIQEERNHISSKINKETTEINFSLEPIECNQSIAGIVRDKETGAVLANAEIQLFINDKSIETTISNENGAYTFATICETAYTIKASKNDYLQEERNHTSSKTNKASSNINFNLKPVECNQSIAGVIRNQKTNSRITNAEISLIKDGIILEKITTITDGSFEFKELLDCNSKYTIIARHIDFEVKSNEISTDTKISKENYINIELIEIIIVEEFITEKGVMLIKTNPIYFDLNKSDIREDAAIELNKVVKIMEDNPTIKIELNSHTDSRAPDGYNMRLSNDRAKSSINYIISQGINPARLSGKGYGETRLVNKCSNGVKCTNLQHEENRRTEFIVINE